jgi:hypothetical protein
LGGALFAALLPAGAAEAAAPFGTFAPLLVDVP